MEFRGRYSHGEIDPGPAERNGRLRFARAADARRRRRGRTAARLRSLRESATGRAAAEPLARQALCPRSGLRALRREGAALPGLHRRLWRVAVRLQPEADLGEPDGCAPPGRAELRAALAARSRRRA